jgi:hypothetical protein
MGAGVILFAFTVVAAGRRVTAQQAISLGWPEDRWLWQLNYRASGRLIEAVPIGGTRTIDEIDFLCIAGVLGRKFICVLQRIFGQM